ncbi:Uroporphyrinogen-III synthase [Buchnera aphidicola (Hyalopterus amygdali)]
MKILIMRPSPEGEELVHYLNNAGIFSFHFSFFDFYPSTSKNRISKKIYDLYISDIILIFSKKSINYINIYFLKKKLIWPIYPKYYAIGESTAIFLSKYVQKKIFFPKDQENSENLLMLLYKNNLLKKKITLLQGRNGRNLIKKHLQQQGCDISIIECYKRIFKIIDFCKEVKKWRDLKINTILITSSEVLNKLNNEISILDKREWLFKCKIFVIGERLAGIAKKIGWNRNDIIISDYANNKKLFRLIMKENKKN